MQSHFRLIVLVATLAALSVDTARADDMTLQFKFTSRNRCSAISPAFNLSGVPQNTKQLRFKMEDFQAPNFNHGGGTVAYAGQSAIPEGALKSFYGPCPPQGVHRYQITVDAIDYAGAVLAATKTVEPCCSF
ncbi:MAG TPA: hypothetical protein VIJ42_12020 [Stellaceae bacterium]